MKLLDTAIRLQDDLCGNQLKLRGWIKQLLLERVDLAVQESEAQGGGRGEGGHSSKHAKVEVQAVADVRVRATGGKDVELELVKGSFCECYRRAAGIWDVAVVRRVISARGEPPEPHVEVAFLKVGSESISGGLENIDTDVVPFSYTRGISCPRAQAWLSEMTGRPFIKTVAPTNDYTAAAQATAQAAGPATSYRPPFAFPSSTSSRDAHQGRGGGGRGRGGDSGKNRGRGKKSRNSWQGHQSKQKKKVWEQSPLPGVLSKYWAQRYRYWSKFDEGVEMTIEDWHSVTPEVIAEHIAHRCGCGVILDPFCGCGGNAVRFAQNAKVVICIDIDPARIASARHNARIYGVADRIEFIVGDATRLLPFMSADAVFLSPPWGGPGYMAEKTVDLRTLTPPPLDGVEIFRLARAACHNVAYFLPRNSRHEQLAALADPGEVCEVESQWLNGKLKTITAYYGLLAEGAQDSESEDEETTAHGEQGDVQGSRIAPSVGLGHAATPVGDASLANDEDDLYESWFDN
jgi:trimethylguanosine synthase